MATGQLLERVRVSFRHNVPAAPTVPAALTRNRTATRADQQCGTDCPRWIACRSITA